MTRNHARNAAQRLYARLKASLFAWWVGVGRPDRSDPDRRRYE